MPCYPLPERAGTRSFPTGVLGRTNPSASTTVRLRVRALRSLTSGSGRQAQLARVGEDGELLSSCDLINISNKNFLH